MAQVFHRYLGKNGKIPKPPKPTAAQKERQGSDARLQAAKARKEEALAAIRETELARKHGELFSYKVHIRLVGYALRCFERHYRSAPDTMLQLFLRTWRGKLDHVDDADKHAAKMAVNAQMREWLAELEANLCRVPAEFLKEEAA